MEYYLKDDQGNYINVEEFTYPVEAGSKENAKPMSVAMAKSFIAKNPTWEMEEAS